MAEQGASSKLTRCIGLVIAAAIVFVAAEGLAIAQTPAGCSANNLFVGISKDKTLITSGETVNYQVSISNGGAGACDVINTDVVFHCPAADGTATGSNVVLTTDGDYPADGTGNVCWNSGGTGGCLANAGLACVVTLTTVPGTATARVNVGGIGDQTKGVLLDSPTGSTFDASKDLNLDVVECTTNSQCEDGLFCTDDLCVSNVCQSSAHPCPADSDLCTTESCDENANACVSSQPRNCNDSDVCTDDSCVPATGQCSNVFDPENDPSCAPASGRMTGGGSVFTSKGGTRVTHGFELHCDPEVAPNNLEVNWNGNHFHMEELLTASCIDAPGIDWPPAPASFDTYIGTGVGRCNGVEGATISFTFTDAGEPGSQDTANIVITGCPDDADISVNNNLKKGNHQAHK
ncbi:MAG TPA: hypothetical protein VLG15_09835 [Thermoanaerobaculia bacterium]|nr:hypothetical protein [Thermoanaerobaculia bacterium]